MMKKRLSVILGGIVTVLLLSLGTRAAMTRFYRSAYPAPYKDAVLACAEENGLSPELVFAVIRCESGFDHRAVSRVEARGLMQITGDTFEWARWRMGDDESLTFEAMFEPETNIRYGSVILRLLLDEFGSERVALSAYHAGWGSVKGWLEDGKYSPDGKSLSHIPFGDTRAYVDKVLSTKKAYQTLYDF